MKQSTLDNETRHELDRPASVDAPSWELLERWTTALLQQCAERHRTSVERLLSYQRGTANVNARRQAVWNLRTRWLQSANRRQPMRFVLREALEAAPFSHGDWMPLSFPVIAHLLRRGHHSSALILYREACARVAQQQRDKLNPSATREP